MSTVIVIEGVSLPLRPTPLAKLMRAMPIIAKGLDSEEGVEAMTEALFHGIRRAKGEITLEWLRENIDFHNSAEVFTTFVEVNGLKPKAASVGEAVAGPAS